MKTVKRKGKVCFACNTCFFVYKDKEVAEECEAFCAAHNACSTEITKHAIGTLKNEDELVSESIDEDEE